ncbi:hypothetical protein BDV37DRAFT_281143 [Aspergillus pseudonomiae]|uniref:DUF7580 domain-containing protein n=1 Tax=Aspergillus pseudonomiae TaxID=1506151 RepID=A0A5N7DJP5_9EURO|nr:uncharacterized protein BDV37DRAFT_281143 [Aspergillus pseudonomiae]KAE8406233.1 hypothetical protein BDV37DRAFT_281143 [Aspergillus pseudonomiae]
MAFLLECEEWRVLQAIATLLEEGKAYCEPRALTVPGWSQDLHQLFWVELRGILAYRERDPYLPMALFHNCQVKLSNVCVLLSRLVNCRRVTVHAEGEAETCEYKGSAYPFLHGLVSFLQTSTGILNLAGGPDSVLLELPRGISQIEQYLYTVMECNRLIKGLFQAPTVQHGASGQPIFTVKGPMWSDTRHRDKAITVFRSLFERLRCGIQHEILLKVPDNSLPRHVQQELYLLLRVHKQISSWLRRDNFDAFEEDLTVQYCSGGAEKAT